MNGSEGASTPSTVLAMSAEACGRSSDTTFETRLVRVMSVMGLNGS